LYSVRGPFAVAKPARQRCLAAVVPLPQSYGSDRLFPGTHRTGAMQRTRIGPPTIIRNRQRRRHCCDAAARSIRSAATRSERTSRIYDPRSLQREAIGHHQW